MPESTLGLLFEISADPSKAEGALGRFTSGTMGQLAILTGGITAIGGALLAMSLKAAQAGTEIYEASEKTGISAEKLSGLRINAKLLGESFDSLVMAVGRAERNLATGLGDSSSKAGKDLRELMGSTQAVTKFGLLPMEDRIALVTKRIFEMHDIGERNRLLIEFFGRGALQNISILQKLAEEGYAPAIARAKAFGQFFTAEKAAEMRQYLVEYQSAKANLEGISMVIGAKAIPAFTQILGLIAGNANMTAEFRAELELLGIGLKVQAISLFNFFGIYDKFIEEYAAEATGVETRRFAALKRFKDEMAAFAVAVKAATGGFDDDRKDHKKKLDDEDTEIKRINELFSELNLAVTTTDAAYREYLRTLGQINRIHDEHSQRVLASLSEQRFAWELLQRYAKLSKDEQEWRIKATQSMHAETVEIKAQNAAWNEALATRLKIHPQTVEFIREMNQAGVSTKQLREEVIRTFVLGLPSSLNVSREALGRWANDVKIQVTTTRAVFVMLKDTVREMEAGMAQALGQSIAAAIVYQKSIGAAMAAAVKAELAGIAGRALVKALWETAEGIACLATWNFAAAALHFKAAAIYGVVGGVAAGIGRAIPGGEYGGGGGGYAAGPAYGPARTAAPPALAPGAAGGGRFSEGGVTVIFQGPVYGGKAGIHELVTDISQAVERQGARLVATRSRELPVRGT